MGLNIRAYKGINLVAKVDEDVDILSNHIKIYDFGWSQQVGLKTNGVYSYEDRMTGFSKPYSSYGFFRNELAKIAGYKPVDSDDGYPCLYSNGAWEVAKKGKSGLLMELINFSDCEGYLDNKTCKKLLQDFNKLKSKINELDENVKADIDNFVDMLIFVGDDGFLSYS